MLRITVCLGSSCFARGNQRNLEVLREWLRRRGAEAQIELSGTLCEGRCSHGPNVVIGGTLYEGVTPEAVVELVDQHLGRLAASPAAGA